MASFETVEQAIAAGADGVGFVCAVPTSPRTIALEAVAEIVRQVPPSIATFLLTSESSVAGIAAQVAQTGVSTVQLIAPLPVCELQALAERLPRTQRIQVIHVEEPGALEQIDRTAEYVDGFLLDSGQPSSVTPTYGGTGKTHDWAISAACVQRSSKPVYLAGGLHPGNVAEAIRRVRPHGVDVCSGVRTHGQLDPEKLKAFIAVVRSVQD